jgi:hypothetical protein
MWKEAVVTYLKALPRHVLVGTEENNEYVGQGNQYHGPSRSCDLLGTKLKLCATLLENTTIGAIPAVMTNPEK